MYTLFFNATIYTLQKKPFICNALLIHNNKIIYCGNEQEINIPENQIKRINLNGLTVLPSFIDCHTHTAMAARKYDHISLDHCLTFEETIDEIKNNIDRFENGAWIKGGGWNANLWPDITPNKSHLDEVSDNHPIALFNKDLHTMWLNSLAIKLSGFEKEIPSSLKNKIVFDENGDLSGLIYEDACQIVEKKSKSISHNKDENNLIKYSEQLLKNGITSVHCMENMEDLELFIKMQRSQQLKTRICFHPPAEEVDTITNAKILSGYGNEWLRFGGLKYYVDGSMGSQTAEMFEKFETLDHAGVEVLTQSELSQKVKDAAKNGLSATIHAIGDKANHKTLNALEETINQIKTQFPLRHRIEHSQIIQDSDLPRFAALNIIASVQPLHISDDVKISDKYLGLRAKNAYPINSLFKSGARVVFGSDAPVADFNPFKGMQAAIARRYNLDGSEPSWYPDQNITISEAISAYTKDAAFASYEESLKGTLQPGKLADFVVLSEDPLNAENPENCLRNIEVVATVLDGKSVYKNDNYDF